MTLFVERIKGRMERLLHNYGPEEAEPRGIILELKPREGVDFEEFVLDYTSGRRVDLSQYEVGYTAR